MKRKTKNQSMSHDELCRILAGAYHTFLCALINAKPDSDVADVYEGGITHSDCKGHFLSNAYLSLYTKHFMDADWIFHSEAAKKKIEKKERKGLRFEHIVPKERYIQETCWRLVEENDGDARAKIEELLKKYWFVALITADEDARLTKDEMPDGWNGDIFARYKRPKDGGSQIRLFRADGSPCW